LRGGVGGIFIQELKEKPEQEKAGQQASSDVKIHLIFEGDFDQTEKV